MSTADERVRLLTRQQCHLCAGARQVVQSVCAELSVSWAEVDIDTDPELQRQFGELVPVVQVDGVQVGYWRIDADRLRAAVTGAPRRRSLRRLLRGR